MSAGAWGMRCMGQTIHILIADSCPLEREGISSIVKKCMRNVVIYEADAFASISEILDRDSSIRLVSLDDRYLELDGLMGIGDLVSRYCGVYFILIGKDLSRDAALSILRTGVQGYVPKSLGASHIAEAFGVVLSGRIYLPPTSSFVPIKYIPNGIGDIRADRRLFTNRQLEVIGLLVEGNSNKQIARTLNISESTVKVHVNAAFCSLGVHNRRSAIAKLRRVEEGHVAGRDHPGRILRTVKMLD